MKNNTPNLPNSLVEAVRYFADAERCFEFVKSLRWTDGEVACPRCGGADPIFITTRKIWNCKACKRQFSLKVGTIFEDSGLGFDKWLPAIWLIANSKNGISSCELGRSLGVTQKTAWFMIHRIRLAMASGTFQKLSGTVETDETYIGGLAKNMHVADRKRKIHGTGGTDKVAIYGALERGGQVVATVIEEVQKATVQASVRAWVESGATLYTDQAHGYIGLDGEFVHRSVNHGTGEYVVTFTPTLLSRSGTSISARGKAPTRTTLASTRLATWTSVRSLSTTATSTTWSAWFQSLLAFPESA
jgi:transposase-like protein